MSHKWILVLSLAVGILCTTTLSACSALPKAPTAPPENQEVPQEEATITISNFTYEPASVTVRPGATIRVINRDGVGHSVTSDNGSAFDTGVIGANAVGEFTAPTTAGEYSYHCTPHPSMQGKIIVE
jgi:plastocyanin